MKVLRHHVTRSLLIAALAIAAAVAWSPVARSGAEPLQAAATGTGSPPAASSFSGIFLDIPGIGGESSAAGHVGSIEVSSWSWGVSAISAGSTGAGSGAVGAREIKGHVTLIKRIDKASPPLLTRCSTGQPIPSATVQLVRFDGQTYLRYDLRNLVVTASAHGDLDGDGAPDEKIDLDLGGGTLTYTQFDAAGKPVGQTTATW